MHPLESALAILREIRRGTQRSRRARHQDRRSKPRPRGDDDAQRKGRDDPDPRRRVSVPQEQGGLDQGRRAHHRAGARRGGGKWRRRSRDRGRRDHHCDRLRKHPPPRHQYRRAAHRVLDRRPGARPGAGTARGHRRRLYRAGIGIGVVAARRQGDGRRISRPHPAEYGPGAGARLAAHPGALRSRVQARDKGRRRRTRQRGGDVTARARERRRRREPGCRCRARRDRQATLYKRARPRRGRGHARSGGARHGR